VRLSGPFCLRNEAASRDPSALADKLVELLLAYCLVPTSHRSGRCIRLAKIHRTHNRRSRVYPDSIQGHARRVDVESEQ